METLELIKKRISANKFDTAKSLSQEEIRELVGYATHAPSSFNLQNWRFIAVTEQADKERLKVAAFGQQKVVDAAVTFIVLGDLSAAQKLPDILGRSVQAGILDQKTADTWVAMIANPPFSTSETIRDTAVTSASLAAMTLMLAAEARGLVSGPMNGFDSGAVKKEFNISDRYVPVMLIAVGYPASGNWPRKPRLCIDEVLAFDTGREF